MILAFHLNAISFSTIALASAGRIVDCLIEGTLVAAFAGLVLRLARGWNSGTRFAVWFCALMAIAALPLFGAILAGPGWMGSAGAPAAGLTRAEITLPGSWALWLFAAWAAMAAIGLARVSVGMWRVHGLRRSCVEVDYSLLEPELSQTLGSTCKTQGSSLGRTRSAVLCVSDRVSVPTVIGFLRPAVVIPQWLLQELSASELKQVLMHELAHLKRWDDWTNLAQKILQALLFFHPAAWWIETQLSLEREMACDDAVVAETANPRAYAECLTHLAEKSFARRSLALAQAALGRIRQTSLRVAQILHMNPARTPKPSWKPAMALVAGFAIVCAAGIARVPRLVGFEDSFPPAQLATAPSAPSVSMNAASSILLDQEATRAGSRNMLRAENASFRSRRPHTSLTLTKTTQKIEVAQIEIRPSGPLSVVVAGANAATLPSMTSDLYYLPDFATELRPATETLFIVVETRQVGFTAGRTVPAAYRISIWRVGLQQPAGSSDTNRIPHKET